MAAPIRILALAGLAIVLACALPAQAQQRQSLEERVVRLERLLSGSGLVELLDRVDSLQREVRELRGELEQQSHAISQLKQRQRELYLDVDRRLRRVEAGGASAAAPAGVEPEPSAGTAPAGAAQTPAPAPARSPAPAASAPQAGAPAADPVKEQAAYQSAFNLLKEGRYEQAAKAFRAFQEQFPEGGYADNAQYWLGEVYYVTRQFPEALEEFSKLVQQHPKSPKLADALLKIGYVHHELGDLAKARQVLEDLISSHPGSTAARLARERLNRLKSE